MKNLYLFLLACLNTLVAASVHAGCSISAISENQYLFDKPGMMLASAGERYVFALDEGVGNVSVIRTEDRNVVQQLGVVGDEPAGMALDATGARLFVTGMWDGTIYRVDVSNPEQPEVTHSAQPGSALLGPVAYHAARQQVIVADVQTNTLLLLSPRDLSVQGEAAGGSGDKWAEHMLIVGAEL